MVAIEQDSAPLRSGSVSSVRFQGWAMIGIAAALVTIGGAASRGFGDDGLRLGGEVAWRFAFLIYFLAIVAGPLARLMPAPALRRLCEQRRHLIWGFCTSFGIYLAIVTLPNFLRPAGPGNEGGMAGSATFALFGVAIVGVIALAARRDAARFLGESVRATLLGMGMAVFWLTYALDGLAHITGPHRPENFYGLSLSLMILALLLRFADCLAAKVRAPRKAV